MDRHASRGSFRFLTSIYFLNWLGSLNLFQARTKSEKWEACKGGAQACLLVFPPSIGSQPRYHLSRPQTPSGTERPLSCRGESVFIHQSRISLKIFSVETKMAAVRMATPSRRPYGKIGDCYSLFHPTMLTGTRKIRWKSSFTFFPCPTLSI